MCPILLICALLKIKVLVPALFYIYPLKDLCPIQVICEFALFINITTFFKPVDVTFTSIGFTQFVPTIIFLCSFKKS